MSMNMMTELIPNIRYLMDRQTPIICIMYDDEWSDEVILLLLTICSSSQCQQSIITMQTGDIKMKCQQSAGHGWCLLCWHCSTVIIMLPIILEKTVWRRGVTSVTQDSSALLNSQIQHPTIIQWYKKCWKLSYDTHVENLTEHSSSSSLTINEDPNLGLRCSSTARKYFKVLG